MATPFIGEIKMFGGNFAPRGFARCDGQLLSIAQNDALFALIGTTYGGDGQTTFSLPDLRGRVPVHQGTNQSTSYVIGSRDGLETVALSSSQIPAHNHNLNAGAGGTKSTSPTGAYFASGGAQHYASNRVSPLSGSLAGGLAPAGGGLRAQQHDAVCRADIHYRGRGHFSLTKLGAPWLHHLSQKSRCSVAISRRGAMLFAMGKYSALRKTPHCFHCWELPMAAMAQLTLRCQTFRVARS